MESNSTRPATTASLCCVTLLTVTALIVLSFATVEIIKDIPEALSVITQGLSNIATQTLYIR